MCAQALATMSTTMNKKKILVEIIEPFVLSPYSVLGENEYV